MTSFELQTRDGVGGEETLEVEQMDSRMDNRVANQVVNCVGRQIDSPIDNQMDNRKEKSSSIQDEVSHNKNVVTAESLKVDVERNTDVPQNRDPGTKRSGETQVFRDSTSVALKNDTREYTDPADHLCTSATHSQDDSRGSSTSIHSSLAVGTSAPARETSSPGVVENNVSVDCKVSDPERHNDNDSVPVYRMSDVVGQPSEASENNTETTRDYASSSNSTCSCTLTAHEETPAGARCSLGMHGPDADGDPESPTRAVWAHSAEFFASCLGYTLGLETVWRFPHLMAKNGGGAFLLPYFLFMVLLGIPMLYLEMCLGQYTSQGPMHVWLIAPLFGGIGYSMIAISVLVACYQSVFFSWLLYYLFASMTTDPPWLHCSSDWSNNDCCENRFYIKNCTLLYPDLFIENSSCYICYESVLERNTTINDIYEILDCPEDHQADNRSTGIICNGLVNSTMVSISVINDTTVSPEEQYFHRVVLGLTKDVTEIGIVQWKLFLCLVLTCGVIFCCICKNIVSAGKVAYVTTITPALILISLLVKSSLLEGSRDGVLHYLHPQWQRLSDSSVRITNKYYASQTN